MTPCFSWAKYVIVIARPDPMLREYVIVIARPDPMLRVMLPRSVQRPKGARLSAGLGVMF